MLSKEAQNIIIKYLSLQATSIELDELQIWIQNSENKKFFHAYVRTNYAIDYNMRKFSSDNLKAILGKEIAKERKVTKLKNIRKKLSYASAAILIGLLATTYFLKDNLFSNNKNIKPIILNTIEAGTDRAILTMEDGFQVTLQKGISFKTLNASSNGEELTYEAEKNDAKKIVYNYLTIPRGGQFFVKLSDGTQVWLNSESQLKYPVSFINGETRKVELIYGEAYFIVSPSTKNKGSKFMVFNNAQEVEVLGTEFNIKAYKDETNIYTTLVEGKVRINFENGNKNLLPNQQLNLNINTKSSLIKDVEVYNEISWKEGVFSFERKPLKEIMKVLSRWYDMEVVFENKALEDVKFFGVLDKEQSITEILQTIKKFKIIENFEINGNVITLK